MLAAKSGGIVTKLPQFGASGRISPWPQRRKANSAALVVRQRLHMWRKCDISFVVQLLRLK
jgi:hypothetical protein